MATNMEKAAKMIIEHEYANGRCACGHHELSTTNWSCTRDIERCIEQIANSWATNTGSKEHLKADLRELCEAVQAKAVADTILNWR